MGAVNWKARTHHATNNNIDTTLQNAINFSSLNVTIKKVQPGNQHTALYAGRH